MTAMNQAITNCYRAGLNLAIVVLKSASPEMAERLGIDSYVPQLLRDPFTQISQQSRSGTSHLWRGRSHGGAEIISRNLPQIQRMGNRFAVIRPLSPSENRKRWYEKNKNGIIFDGYGYEFIVETDSIKNDFAPKITVTDHFGSRKKWPNDSEGSYGISLINFSEDTEAWVAEAPMIRSAGDGMKSTRSPVYRRREGLDYNVWIYHHNHLNMTPSQWLDEKPNLRMVHNGWYFDIRPETPALVKTATP